MGRWIEGLRDKWSGIPPCQTTSSHPAIPSSIHPRKSGFTLVEVILVVVISLILMGISLPYFSHAYKGTKLRIAARTVSRMARYARSMAIMRETTMTLVLNEETMEIYLGGEAQASTNAADGKLDQDVLKRLGYVDGGASGSDPGIEREIHHLLPDGLSVTDFRKEDDEDGERYENLDIVHYYPDGQSDAFLLELEDRRGLAVRLESDPISGKIRSEFVQ